MLTDPNYPVCVLAVPESPRGVQRARRDPKHGHWYTPEETRKLEAMIGVLWQRDVQYTYPKGVPLRLEVEAVMPRPPSVKRDLPTVKPDWDNIAKIVDGLNLVAWMDDAQIVSGSATKRYVRKGEEPHLIIRVEAVYDELAGGSQVSLPAMRADSADGAAQPSRR